VYAGYEKGGREALSRGPWIAIYCVLCNLHIDSSYGRSFSAHFPQEPSTTHQHMNTGGHTRAVREACHSALCSIMECTSFTHIPSLDSLRGERLRARNRLKRLAARQCTPSHLSLAKSVHHSRRAAHPPGCRIPAVDPAPGPTAIQSPSPNECPCPCRLRLPTNADTRRPMRWPTAPEPKML
jgi:hypothetical protein